MQAMGDAITKWLEKSRQQMVLSCTVKIHLGLLWCQKVWRCLYYKFPKYIETKDFTLFRYAPSWMEKMLQVALSNLTLLCLKLDAQLTELAYAITRAFHQGECSHTWTTKVAPRSTHFSGAFLNLHVKSTLSFTYGLVILGFSLPPFWSRISLGILTVHLNYCSSRAGPNLSEDILLFLCSLFPDCWCFSCQHTHSMNIFFSKFWKGDRNLLLVSFIFFFLKCDMWWQVDHVKVNLWSATSKIENLMASLRRWPW